MIVLVLSRRVHETSFLFRVSGLADAARSPQVKRENGTTHPSIATERPHVPDVPASRAEEGQVQGTPGDRFRFGQEDPQHDGRLGRRAAAAVIPAILKGKDPSK